MRSDFSLNSEKHYKARGSKLIVLNFGEFSFFSSSLEKVGNYLFAVRRRQFGS